MILQARFHYKWTHERAAVTIVRKPIANHGEGGSGKLFQPFQRLAAGRTSRGEGLGLGLSIVQAIAQTHSAAITTRPQPEGRLLIEVTFPNLTPPVYPSTPGDPHARVTAAALISAAAIELA